MKDLNFKLITGIDIPLDELGLIIHPMTLEEIAMFGETNFFSTIHLLCLNKNMLPDNNIPDNYSNFKTLMTILSQKEFIGAKQNIITLLQMLFPRYNCMITPNSFIFDSKEQDLTVMIDENNFEIFQDFIKEVMCLNNTQQDGNIIYNPVTENAKRIAAKIMKGRKKVAQLKQKENESPLTTYVSILAIGTGLSIHDIKKYTLFQLFDQMERNNLYINSKVALQISTSLAGSEAAKDIDSNWTKNIH